MLRIEKVQRAQKVQATQTDGMKIVSPATPHKVKSVLQKTTTKKNTQAECSKSIVR